jgi:hypothetical protein
MDIRRCFTLRINSTRDNRHADLFTLACVVVAMGECLFIERQIEIDQEEEEEKILIQ